MATVNMPSRAPTQLDALTTALNIGQAIYGIKYKAEELERAKQEDELKRIAANEESEIRGLTRSALLSDQQKRQKQDAIAAQMEKGEFSPLQLPKFLKESNLALSDKPTQLRVKVGSQDLGYQDVYLKPAEDVDKEYKIAQTQLVKKQAGEIGKLSKLDEQKLINAQAEYQRILNDSSNEKSKFAQLPTENQEMIQAFAKKNVNIATIRNNLRSGLNALNDPSISHDQKVTQGKMLLKTINSPEGADAIGSEESKRLGAYLEFNIIPNLFNPGPVFGRDLEEFTKQVALKSDQLSNTLDQNMNTIKQLREGKPFNNFMSGDSDYQKTLSALNKNKRGGLLENAQAEEVKIVLNPEKIKNPPKYDPKKPRKEF